MRVVQVARASLVGAISLTMVASPVWAQQVASAATSAESSGAAAVTLPSSIDPNWEKEFALWQAASSGNTKADFEAYLAAYPEGKFATIAKNRIGGTASAITPATTVALPVAVANSISTTAAIDGSAVVSPALSGNAKDPSWETEYAIWKAASDGNTPAEYQAYLNAYPNGKFAAIAQSRSMRLSAGEPEAGVQTQVASLPATATPPDLAAGTPETDANLLDQGTRHEVQGRLTSLGFSTGGTDGVFGRQSREALSHWQAAAGAPVTGFLGYDQLVKLRRDSNVSYPQWLADARRHVVHRNPDRVLIGRVDNSGEDAAIALGVLGFGAAILGAGIGGHHGGFHGGFHGGRGCHHSFC